MSSIATTTFPYPPLPVGVDALRILILQPGDFSDPIKCTLTPAAFSMKPKYLALSYTWRDSYPDNSELPIGRFPDKKKKGVDAAIDVNDIPFYVRHNLRLALLHLRSPTQPLPIWADAICINQADTQERNAQVAIMSFIYMRALKVVTWLGVKDYGKRHLNPFHGMAMDWKAGQTRHLPTIVAASQDRQHCYSLEPDHATFARIVQSAYWPRLWIVQEVCLPRQLVVVYGSKMWKYEDLCQWDVLLKVRTSSISAEISPSAVTAGENANDPGIGIGAMIRLLDARDARHTSSTVLERLIETFAKSAC
ncbi:heterokaryon incompatibility protein-domain-containing protein, partial [Bombardia bombarda]